MAGWQSGHAAACKAVYAGSIPASASNIMKIAIIGMGFVGKSLFNGFKDSAKILGIDPIYNNSIKDLSTFMPDAAFICVPTPMNEDASQDISIIKSVINEINELNLNMLVVLKSTVLPNYVNEIEQSVSKFVYNPEFLRERYANEDFINSELIVFGGKRKDAKELALIYENHTKCTCREYIYTDAVAASFLKYTINSFLSLKVSYFNELKELFDRSGSKENWSNFISALSLDKRIGNSHMQVPGPDGRFGFGGACFPKDTNAFLNYSKNSGKQLNLLNTAIILNNIIRSEYNDLTDRELEQNIKYFNGDKD